MCLKFRRLLYLPICLVLLNISMSWSFVKKCTYPTAKEHLSTKTPYTYVAGDNSYPVYFRGCTPVKVWSIIRHGTRNPGKALIEKMRGRLPALKSIVVEHHDAGKGELCPEIIPPLRTWEPSVDPSEAKFLAYEGEEEMQKLAERWQDRYPDLLTDTYSPRDYSFRHTATQRTKESAEHFTVGLFGQEQKSQVRFPEPLAKDPILRFYKLCDKWRVEVDKNPMALIELKLFQQSHFSFDMLDNISKRIGLTNRFKFDDAKLIYQTCAFETAWNPSGISPWCALLTREDFEILEYAEDLEKYWIDGYGFPINYQQACVAIKDMFEHFTNDSLPQNTFYFTHSGTILKVLAYLGLYKDPQPLRSNKIDETRLWRTSKIDAFGSNIAFVLFECEDRVNKVLTLHQEKPVILPGCQHILCSLEEMKHLYRHALENCDFDEMCRLDHDEL